MMPEPTAASDASVVTAAYLVLHKVLGQPGLGVPGSDGALGTPAGHHGIDWRGCQRAPRLAVSTAQGLRA